MENNDNVSCWQSNAAARYQSLHEIQSSEASNIVSSYGTSDINSLNTSPISAMSSPSSLSDGNNYNFHNHDEICKLLIIYAGGTIGMQDDPDHGFYPIPGYLHQQLASIQAFHDSTFPLSSFPCKLMHFSSSSLKRLAPLITPIYGNSKRVLYEIIEYDPLLDSSNMTMDSWIKIATDIEKYYQIYDAFLILHGTDTMAYTASALSFLLEGLGKPVIITGSQIPLSKWRNDAQQNLLGAFVLCTKLSGSHCKNGTWMGMEKTGVEEQNNFKENGRGGIGEVAIFFNGKLMRGNRSRKINALALNAFDSPNLKPLASVSINVDIDWSLIIKKGGNMHELKAWKKMNPNVGTLRLFPGITKATVQAFLNFSSLQGVVLETFGAGNAPNNRPDLLAVLKEAIDNGVIIVNCSQCLTGVVSDIYATGRALTNIGVIAGIDMTPECALTKLMYLLGKREEDENLNIKKLMQTNLRGELSIMCSATKTTHLARLYSSITLNSGMEIKDKKMILKCFLTEGVKSECINSINELLEIGKEILDDEIIEEPLKKAEQLKKENVTSLIMKKMENIENI